MGDEEETGKGDIKTDRQAGRQRQRVGDGEIVTKRNGRERETETKRQRAGGGEMVTKRNGRGETETERQRVGDGEMVMRRREREEGKGMEGRDRDLGMGR